MKKLLLSRWMEHPLTLVSLVTVAGVLAVSWRRAVATPTAPDLPNYNWVQHPKTLMIVQPDKDCGCGGTPCAPVEAASKKGWDVLYLTGALTSDLKALQKEFRSSKHFLLLSNTQPALIRQFAPKDRSVFFSIKEGKITERFDNSESAANYFVKEGSANGSES